MVRMQVSLGPRLPESARRRSSVVAVPVVAVPVPVPALCRCLCLRGRAFSAKRSRVASRRSHGGTSGGRCSNVRALKLPACHLLTFSNASV
jgi:hypothetical protein